MLFSYGTVNCWFTFGRLQCDRLVFAASILCRTFGIPPLIIGMTVVSIGTSLPEVIVSLAASLHEQRDLAVGTASLNNYQYIADPRSGCAGSSFYRPF